MKVYSAAEVACSCGGIPIDSGRGNDTFAEIEAMSEKVTVVEGIDGEATVSVQKGTTHIVNLTLMQSSDGNDVLSAIMKAAEASAGGRAGVFPFVLRDTQGTSLLTSLDAMLAGWPKQPFGKEVGVVTWKIFVMNPDRHVGGNSGT